MAQEQKPMFRVYTVIRRGRNDPFWLNIGVAFYHRDGQGLSVRPKSFCFPAKLSEHDADGRPAQERQGVAVQALPILGQPPAPVQPADGPLDDPAFGQNHEGLRGIRSLYDLKIDLL